MKRLRGGRGLGDSLYLRPVAKHLVDAGDKVVVLSDYPDIFIGTGASVEPFTRDGANVVAHYVWGKANAGSTQWDDLCKSAGVNVPLRFDWKPRNAALIEKIQAAAGGRPIVLVHGGRAPMQRTDGFGMEMLPQKAAFDAVLGELGDCLLVQVGKAPQIYELKAELVLNGSTTVSDLLDIASICAGVVAQCSFAVPLAEGFDKPLLAVWAARGLLSQTEFIKRTTPQKVLSAPRDRFVIDDWPLEALQENARAFCQF